MFSCLESDTAVNFIRTLQRGQPFLWFLSSLMSFQQNLYQNQFYSEQRRSFIKNFSLWSHQNLYIGVLSGVGKITSFTQRVYHISLDAIARLYSQRSLAIFKCGTPVLLLLDIFGLTIPSFTLVNSTKQENSLLKLSFLHNLTSDLKFLCL